MNVSAFSLVAAGLYLVVAAAAIAALWRGTRMRQVAWHRLIWAIIAAIFVGLAMLRVMGVEELLRSALRMTLFDDYSYDNRRSLQAPLFAVIFLIASLGVAGLFYVLVKGVRGRRNIASLIGIACACGMIFLLALRLVSLHSVDQLLYGPIKFNWIADLGLTFAVLASAVRYQIVLRTA